MFAPGDKVLITDFSGKSDFLNKRYGWSKNYLASNGSTLPEYTVAFDAGAVVALELPVSEAVGIFGYPIDEDVRNATLYVYYQGKHRSVFFVEPQHLRRAPDPRLEAARKVVEADHALAAAIRGLRNFDRSYLGADVRKVAYDIVRGADDKV